MLGPRMTRERLSTSVCAFLLCAATLLVCVQGHGYMLQPPSRNFLGSPRSGRTESQGILTYTPHGGNGKGVCGDNFEGGGGPFSGLAFGQLAQPTRYTRGQRVTMKVYITAAHGGTYAFQLCDRTSGLDHACFNRWLTRADTGERYWYIFDRGSNQEFSMDFVLPSDFSCPNGCVLRWEYATGNTCVRRETVQGCTSCQGYANGGVYGVGNTPGLCPVGTSLQSGPEVFYNCADVIIDGTPTNCPTNCPAANTCQTGGGCNTATRTCNPVTNAANGSPCTGGTCQNGVCQSGCTTNCPAPSNTCQRGGGCNTATRTCNPITNVANGSPCTGGTCQNGACQPTTGTDPCPGIAPGQSRAACFCRNRPTGRYQDTTYGCSGGFWCYGSGAQYIQCAAGTRYNSQIGVCDFASQVVCDGRVGPASVGLRGARPGTLAPPATETTGSGAADLQQQPAVVDPATVVAASTTEEGKTAAAAPAATEPQVVVASSAPVEPAPVVVSAAEPTAAASGGASTAVGSSPQVLHQAGDPLAAAPAVTLEAAPVALAG